MKVGDKIFANTKMQLEFGKIANIGDYVGTVVYKNAYEVLADLSNTGFTGWEPDESDIADYKLLPGRQYWWFHTGNLIFVNNCLMETE